MGGMQYPQQQVRQTNAAQRPGVSAVIPSSKCLGVRRRRSRLSLRGRAECVMRGKQSTADPCHRVCACVCVSHPACSGDNRLLAGLLSLK